MRSFLVVYWLSLLWLAVGLASPHAGWLGADADNFGFDTVCCKTETPLQKPRMN